MFFPPPFFRLDPRAQTVKKQTGDIARKKAVCEMLRKALVILSGNAAASLLLLARNLIIARMIPVEDYGVAATFAMAMAVVEMASTFGLQQQIIQSKRGDDPYFQAALQGFQVLRGALASVALFALAVPLAEFLNLPEVVWAYQLLAVVPLLNGLQHFDIHRLNRQMRFGPLLLTGNVPALVSLMLVWPLVAMFGDWQVMLWALLVQAVLAALTSHLVAERRYRLVWDRAIVADSLRFGWPLLLNAVLMFLVFQGDKMIVGNTVGMQALAIFAMGVTLTLTPTLVMAKSAQNLFLPRLSQIDRTTDAGSLRFDRLARATLQAAVLNGALLVLGAVLAGEALVGLLLGIKYQALVPLFVAFAVLHALRVFKSGPAVVALACGHSGNAMLANLPRVAALPLGWLLMISGGTLLQLLWLGIAAEALGYVLSLILVWYRPGPALGPLWPMLAAAAGGTSAFVLVCRGGVYVPGLGSDASMAVVAVVAFALLFASMRDLQRLIWRRQAPNTPPNTPPGQI